MDVYVYPTDTVWGIGGPIHSEYSFKQIAKIKKTSEDKPLSVLFSDLSELNDWILFPEKISNEWLRNFFSLETSLLVPVSWKKKDIPPWIYQGSPFFSIRLLEGDFFKSLTKKASGPITSTSLNLTGTEPIVSKKDALLFHKTYCKEASFFENKEFENLSGRSSTMMILKTDMSFEVLRAGLHVEKVKKLCGLSST